MGNNWHPWVGEECQETLNLLVVDYWCIGGRRLCSAPPDKPSQVATMPMKFITLSLEIRADTVPLSTIESLLPYSASSGSYSVGDERPFTKGKRCRSTAFKKCYEKIEIDGLEPLLKKIALDDLPTFRDVARKVKAGIVLTVGVFSKLDNITLSFSSEKLKPFILTDVELEISFYSCGE